MARANRRPLSDEERAERRRQDRESAQEAIELLQSSEGWQAWLASRRHFRSYSLANQCLIAMQKPTATRVAGFRAWLKLGYAVAKGEKAIRIWVPIPPSQQQLEQWQNAGAKREEKPRTYFKLGPVFDRSQVQELPPPAEPAPLDPPHVLIDGDELEGALEPLTALAGELGCTVELQELTDCRGGYYRPQTKAIVLSAERSINQRVSTLVHELGHALVRLEREEEDPALSYPEEELVVESVAYTVCGGLGVDTSGFAIPYLASWAQNAELATIEQTAALIDRLARRIEHAIEGRDEHTAAGDERHDGLQAA